MASDKDRKANIYDVAKLAEVSHQTVSSVLNNHPSIRPATRARVEAAVRELNYRPSMAARALVTNKNRMLGFLVGDTSLFGPAGWLNAIERQARAAGYYAVTVALKNDAPETWADAIEHIRKIGAEGLVCIAIKKHAVELAAQAYPNTPIVGVDTEEVTGVTTIGIDNVAGARIATEHLIELGHKNILHIAGPSDSIDALARLRGYEESMKQHGLKPRVIQGDWATATGFKLGVDLNIELENITAIFTANDHLAMGLMKALRMRGIHMPEQVSIVGFDDMAEAPYFDPPLTTIVQEFNRLGETAMELLIYKINGLKASKPTPMIPKLVVRESTKRI
ncbi:MAG: LacI family DNA-binding transcriptional regulator [Microbacteriaceae bacterium]